VRKEKKRRKRGGKKREEEGGLQSALVTNIFYHLAARKRESRAIVNGGEKRGGGEEENCSPSILSLSPMKKGGERGREEGRPNSWAVLPFHFLDTKGWRRKGGKKRGEKTGLPSFFIGGIES